MTRKPSKPTKAAKKPTAKAKPAPRKSKAPSAPAKSKAKKPEKLLPSKKAVAPAPALAKAKAPKAAAPRGAPVKPVKVLKPVPAAKPAPPAKPAAKVKPPKSSSAGTKKKAALVPIGVAKPGLGHKWACYNCGAKFYDLLKPVPVCPKCESDQRDRPPVVADAAPSHPQAKRPALAPMSRFLDDDEVAAPEPDEFGATPAETETEADEPEAAEIDIDALDEPGGMGGESEFSEPEEE